MKSRIIALALFLILLTSCTVQAEPADSAPEETGESETVSVPVEETVSRTEDADVSEPEDEASVGEEEEPAWTQWVFLDVPITREQAGLDTIPAHSMNGHVPDDYWLAVADGSLPYTDEHFSRGVRHGMEFPFMRFHQRDMVLFLSGYQGELLAGIRIGDDMSQVTDRLGEPTARETYRMEASEYDEFFYKGDGGTPEKTFLHYKGDGFYVSLWVRSR